MPRRSRSRPLRLAVRTSPSHGENTGSIPVGVTNGIKDLADACFDRSNISSINGRAPLWMRAHVGTIFAADLSGTAQHPIIPFNMPPLARVRTAPIAVIVTATRSARKRMASSAAKRDAVGYLVFRGSARMAKRAKIVGVERSPQHRSGLYAERESIGDTRREII